MFKNTQKGLKVSSKVGNYFELKFTVKFVIEI